MPTVEITSASEAQQSTIENLIQLYTHDFSEHWAGMPHGELEEDGRFPPYPLEAYWQVEGHLPLLLWVDGFLAGFSLVNCASHSGMFVQHNMAEFFVVRKHRGGGVGAFAATEIFRRCPGQWEVAVARRNAAAYAFWRKVIGRYPGMRQGEEFDLKTSAWDGPILRFQSV